jgi:uncharacterized protein YqjF (DUF2071 family)
MDEVEEVATGPGSAGAFPARAVGSTCPLEVQRPVFLMWWDELTFLHWRYDPEQVQRLLPPGVTVETFDGDAWVGLVPFRLGFSAPRTKPLPWFGVFPETNVRTYVTGPDGEDGVWFFSLDAARLIAVLGARLTYHLPYVWSDMAIERRGDELTYDCTRRWGSAPGRPRHPRSHVRVRVGEPFAAAELTELDHWLTARWRLWAAPRTGPRFALAEHPVWPLQRVEVLALEDELVAAAGLPQPEGPPRCHWAPSVEVRVSRPYRHRPDGPRSSS